LPAVSTVGAILRRAGLIRPRARRRARQRHDAGVLTPATRPNQVWTVDYKGWFRTRDGQRCDPLTIADLYSRYVLAVRAVTEPSYGPTRRVFERVFAARGLPERIRCDNGGPFAAAGAGGLSRLSAWWWRLGIQVEYIRPGHPEQNGAHERMHLTLKQDTAQPPAANRRAQQGRMNGWRRQFNEVRPHEALDLQTPCDWYRPSERRYTGTPPQPPYPAAWAVRRVRPSGEIKWQGRRRFVSEALSGLAVGLQLMEAGRQHAWFGSVWLGDLHDADPGGIRATVGCHRAVTALKTTKQKRRRQ
jgi:transposase InsO family protein